MAAPKLRFKEFDADYTNTTFEKLKGFSIQSGKSEEKGDTGEFPFYGSTGVIGYKDIFDYEGKSILIARVGANAGSLYQIDGKYSVSDNTLRLTVSDDTSLDYLRELLIKFNLNRLVFGTGQPLVTGGMIKKVNIFIPEFTEQTKIASFLSNVDEKISQLTQKHALLSQYKQGMMQKLFSQQIRFKADDGSEFGEWENTVIGDIADIVGGGTPSTNNEAYWSGDVVWLTPSEINQKFIGESKRTISELGVQKSSAKKLPIGTILFTSRATIGEVAIAIAEVTTNQGFQSFISNEKTFNEFLYYWIVNNKKSFIERASGSTFLEISKSKIQPMEISLPCLEEQTKIANFLSAIDQKIEVVAQQIEQAKKWKKGLLQQMFV